MSRAAVIVEAHEWDAVQTQIRELTQRVESMERGASKPVGRMTPREVARAFKCRDAIVRDALDRGELAGDRTDKGWLIAPADAEAWWSQRIARQGRRNQ